MDNYKKKIKEELFSKILDVENPIILELGVETGVSTKLFIDLCEKNNGHLFSVDINDCSKVSDSKKWTFIKSRDDNFDFIKPKIKDSIDIIYIDTLHEAEHVKKLIYNYYDNLKVGGYIFIDDISHLPYLNSNNVKNFYCEINNKETFEKIIEIYYFNYENFNLNFSFQSSGLAILKKISNNKLNNSKKLFSREGSIKNLIRKLWLKIKN